MTERPVALTDSPEGYAERLAGVGGRPTLARQAESGWGTKVVDRLSHDPREAFPEMKGFSRANVSYMRAFAEAWSESEIEKALVEYVPEFLPELGVGFAFVGRQVHVEVGDEDFYLDLLFYRVVAEYVLHDHIRPLGIAAYQLAASLPEPLQTSLPTIEQIERELERELP